MIKDNKEVLYLKVSLVVGVSFIFIINCLTPLMGEDLSLAAYSPFDHINGFEQCFLAMIHRIETQFCGWNARIGEQISIVFSCFPKVIFNILNTAISCVFGILIFSWTYKELPNFHLALHLKRILSIFLMIFLLQPAMGEIFFWRTGSTNYLWALVILLIAAMPIRYYAGYIMVS